uniref:Ig-like domain-containing protein n=1 Tax=Terrapene triunguis TaxID=2587831 RepID=A0A674IHU8_9SAUR
MDGLNSGGGRWGLWHEFLKPTISVSPSRVVALGGSVTIHCEGRQRSMEFFLRKAGRPNRQVRTVPDGTVAEFPIASVGQEDGGSYTCDYRSIADHNRWSYPSDPVNMILSYPKPSISLSPSGGVSLGGAVTVRCWGQHQGVQFVLNKERRHFPPADLDGSEAVFSSSNVHQDLGGSYSCSYHSRSEPFAVSYPSDPVELVVRGEGPASASPFPAPPPSQTLTGRRDVRFFLHKAGDLNPQQHVDPAGDGAEFRITTVSRQHGGNYSCSYRPQSEPFISSQPSDTIELVVGQLREGSYPKPSISVSPGGVIPVGGNITIRCQYQLLGMTFLLYKAGDVEYLNYTDPAGSEAEFPITSARREHGGNYTCRYHNKSGIYSEHSDRVQIIVAGEGPSPESRLPASHPARAQGVSVSPGAQQMGRPAQPVKVGWRGDISALWSAVLLLLVAFVCFRKTRASECLAQRGKG